METAGTSKHRSPPWYHLRPSPDRIGMDARWSTDGTHHEAPRRGPTWFCACLCCCVGSHVYSRHQLRDIADGLYYLHSRNVVHGDLKGVRDCSKPCFTAILTRA